jgi:hypothetical protein
VLLRIEGQWAPDIRRFFDVFDSYKLLKLVTLLEAASGGRCQQQALDLLTALQPPAETHRTTRWNRPGASPRDACAQGLRPTPT